MIKKLFTSESVTDGHPDKLCDRISDSVLDAILAKDPKARVACECIATTGIVFVTGEITTDCYVDIPALVRKTIIEVGYDNDKTGFNGNTCAVLTAINEQSPDIAMGVDTGGAGDQGLMFGFACKETPDYMPLAISLAHGLTKKLKEARLGELKYLRPDGKSQVTVEYHDGIPKRVDTVVLSSQHSEDIPQEKIRKDILEKVIKTVIPKKYIDRETKYFINPTGNFVVGGPMGDSGLTGRKIIVDTYGGYCPHGGGAFSGKDPTKVDRSASYMARYICKNLVAADLCDKCELEIAYAIGVAHPVSVFISIDTFGSGKLPESKLLEIIRKEFDLTPRGIIEKLDLRRPIYKQTSSFGHFGGFDYPWEQIDLVPKLKGYLK